MVHPIVLALVLLSADKTAYKRHTVIDFSEVKLTAQVIRPESILIQGRGRTKFRPLIRSRADFRPELERSLDQI